MKDGIHRLSHTICISGMVKSLISEPIDEGGNIHAALSRPIRARLILSPLLGLCRNFTLFADNIEHGIGHYNCDEL